MKKCKRIILLIIFLIIILILFGFLFREYPDDENTLYSIKLDNVMMRIERYDYSLGQNQTVGVEVSKNRGKSYKRVTIDPVVVSMESRFVFLNKKLGFIISKPNLSKYNNYKGIKVTNDGGKTFVDGIINYDNSNIEILTVEDVPYYENNFLKLKCSIYQVKSDYSGYENIDLIFISNDSGLTWDLEK